MQTRRIAIVAGTLLIGLILVPLGALAQTELVVWHAYRGGEKAAATSGMALPEYPAFTKYARSDSLKNTPQHDKQVS